MTDYRYDAAEQLIKLTDAEGRITDYEYDATGRLTQLIKHLAGQPVTVQQIVYTVNGRQDFVRDANGNQTVYSYDGHDRPIRTTYPDSSLEQQVFDAAGNLTAFHTRAGDVIAYDYDNLNRRASKDIAGTELIQYAYDLTGLQTNVTESSGTHSHDYDGAGRLARVTRSDGKRVEYDYDANGNRSKLTYPDGFFLTYEYDALNRLSKVREAGASLLAKYRYDGLSRRTELRYANGAVTTYRYEPDSDLRGVKHQLMDSSPEYTYIRNKLGQVVQQQASAEVVLWQPLAAADDDYLANNLNQYATVNGQGLSYDTNGNLSDDGTNGYDYDAENRLIAVTTPTAGLTYHYDAFGRRVEKVFNGTATGYLYDGNQVIAEYDDNGQLAQRYIHGPGLDEPIALDDGGARYYYHVDGGGSVIALSDEGGANAEQYAYGPFGESLDTSLVYNPYRYTGRRLDEDSGLYYYRARYYHVALGRFLQPDPIGYGDGMNLYAYVGNDPLNFIDPLGLTARGFASRAYNLFNKFVEHGNIVLETTRGSGAGAFLQFSGVDGVVDELNAVRDGDVRGIAVGAGLFAAGQLTRGATKRGAGDLVDAAGGIVKNAKKGDIRAPGGRDRAKELFREFDTKGVGGRTKVRERDGSRAVVGELGDGTPLRIRFKKNGTTRIQAGKQKIQFND